MLRCNILCCRVSSSFTGTTLNFFYHANILFFIDNKYQLHSIINPSVEDSENKKNYRNPEQTRALFKPDSGFNLEGLTIDDNGLMYVNGILVGPKFMPVIRKWQYFINSMNITIGNQELVLIKIPTTLFDPEEIHECTAIHPSGDIYFLRYNPSKNVHILYKIENTWDVEARTDWIKKYQH